MRAMTCDAIWDRLPEFARGALSAVDAAGVDAHLAACDECAAELELLRLLRRHPVTVPAGLRDRVLDAVTRPEPVVIRLPERARRRFDWRFAMRAAAVAAAAAVAGIWFVATDGGVDPTVALEDMDISLAAVMEPFAGWPGSDVHLAGAVVLEQLTDEELEFLLTELEW